MPRTNPTMMLWQTTPQAQILVLSRLPHITSNRKTQPFIGEESSDIVAQNPVSDTLHKYGRNKQNKKRNSISPEAHIPYGPEKICLNNGIRTTTKSKQTLRRCFPATEQTQQPPYRGTYWKIYRRRHRIRTKRQNKKIKAIAQILGLPEQSQRKNTARKSRNHNKTNS